MTTISYINCRKYLVRKNAGSLVNKYQNIILSLKIDDKLLWRCNYHEDPYFRHHGPLSISKPLWCFPRKHSCEVESHP